MKAHEWNLLVENKEAVIHAVWVIWCLLSSWMLHGAAWDQQAPYTLTYRTFHYILRARTSELATVENETHLFFWPQSVQNRK